MRRLPSLLPLLLRLPLILMPPLLAAGCDSGAAPPVLQEHVDATFPRGGVANVIRIEALDRLPLRSAELVAPDGTATAATDLVVDPNPEANGGQEAVSDPWRSSTLTPNGISELPNGPFDSLTHSRDKLLLMAASARIAVPDPVAYQRDWQKYRIRVGFDAGNGQIESREIAAPAPLSPS